MKIYATVLAIAALLLIAGGAFAVDDENITICHATNSESNPYVQLTVDKESINDGGQNDHSQHENDIIPPFDDFEGLNWDDAGQAIWENDCEVVGEPEPTATPEPTAEPTPEPTPEPTATPVAPTATPTLPSTCCAPELTPPPTDVEMTSTSNVAPLMGLLAFVFAVTMTVTAAVVRRRG